MLAGTAAHTAPVISLSVLSPLGCRAVTFPWGPDLGPRCPLGEHQTDGRAQTLRWADRPEFSGCGGASKAESRLG